MKRRVLSLLLILLLCSSLFPAARAEGPETYTYAVPRSAGVANAIARAYLLTDLEWTPLKDVPGVVRVDGSYVVQPFQAGVTYRGVPYSGVHKPCTFLGLNVSVNTFLSALQNEKSVIYTKNLFSESTPKAAAYYGTVCSKLVQYALNIPGMYGVSYMRSIPGMETVAAPRAWTAEQVELGDALVDPDAHAAICTGIRYQEDGAVDAVEVSEAVMPLCRRRWWTPSELSRRFAAYYLCRYDGIDGTPAPEETAVEEDPALMPRYGDGANYKRSDSPAVVDVLREGFAKAVVCRDGTVIQEIELNGAKYFRFDRSVPGAMEMWLETADGERSASVRVGVVDCSVTVTDSSAYFAGALTVETSGSGGAPLYVQVGSSIANFCALNAATGTVRFAPSAVKSYKTRAAYRNEFGVYFSDWTPFEVDELSGTGENPSADPLLSRGVYWYGYILSLEAAIPELRAGREDYWTYTSVPVEPETSYYSNGATRLWYCDAEGKALGTFNAYKEGEPRCRFTTPAGTAYLAVSYTPGVGKPGTERLTKVADPCPHAWGDWRVAVPPSCIEPGNEHRTCTLCGETETREVEAAGHRYENGVCAVCGELDLSAAVTAEDGSLRVSGLPEGVRALTALYDAEGRLCLSALAERDGTLLRWNEKNAPARLRVYFLDARGRPVSHPWEG